MRKLKLEKFGLAAIQKVVSNSDIHAARELLAFAIGSSVSVSGVVLKLIKRNDQCRLFIQPHGEQLTVFTDCAAETDNVASLKIKRGSKVKILGKLEAFGFLSVNLTDCRLKP
jgi:riboflavin synthase alpha subunit